MGRPKGSKNKKGSAKIKCLCKVCGKEFYIYPYRKKSEFCSYKCYWSDKKGRQSAFKGKHHSKEARVKIGKNTPKRFGPNNHAWKGGKTISSTGYVLVRSPKHPARNRTGYVQEHRLVMEKHLGRFLMKGEVVHHINENIRDNRIENLRLMTNSAHTRLHRH